MGCADVLLTTSTCSFLPVPSMAVWLDGSAVRLISTVPPPPIVHCWWLEREIGTLLLGVYWARSQLKPLLLSCGVVAPGMLCKSSSDSARSCRLKVLTTGSAMGKNS